MNQSRKFVFLVSIVILMSGCARVNTKYLPLHDEINSSPYGGFIIMELKDKEKVSGELLAVVGETLIVLLANKKDLSIGHIDKKNLSEYKIKFARSHTDYRKWMGVNALTVFHGFWMIFTLPINLIMTSKELGNHKKLYVLYGKEIPFSALSKFARFPQGIPDNIKEVELVKPYSPSLGRDIQKKYKVIIIKILSIILM